MRVAYFSDFATWLPDPYYTHRQYVAALKSREVSAHGSILRANDSVQGVPRGRDIRQAFVPNAPAGPRLARPGPPAGLDPDQMRSKLARNIGRVALGVILQPWRPSPGLFLRQPNHLPNPSPCRGHRTLALVLETYDSVSLVLCSTDLTTGIEFGIASRTSFIKATWLATSFGCTGRMICPVGCLWAIRPTHIGNHCGFPPVLS